MLEGLLRINIFCYIIIVNLLIFFLSFPIFKLLIFNKSIYIVTSSVHKKTAEERTKENNTYNSLKTGLGFEPGETIPDPARPQVADRGTALRYGG